MKDNKFIIADIYKCVYKKEKPFFDIELFQKNVIFVKTRYNSFIKLEDYSAFLVLSISMLPNKGLFIADEYPYTYMYTTEIYYLRQNVLRNIREYDTEIKSTRKLKKSLY